jgi:uncharacterized protein (TIRG00374 family)
MHKKILSVLQYVLFMGAGIFLVWWQIRAMSPEEMAEFKNALSSTNYWWMIPVVLMSLLSHLSRALRWKLLMEPLGYHPASKNVFAVTMVGYLANAAFPRLGELLKCSILGKYENLKIDKVIGTVLVERAFDFVCYLVFIGITILLQAQLIGGYMNEKIAAMDNGTGIPFWGKMLMIVALIAGVIVGMQVLMKQFPHNKLIKKINGFISGLGTGFATIKNLKHRKLFIFHTMLIWSMYLLQVYIGFFAMEGVGHLGINAAFAVLAIGTLAMIATPNGIGTFPIFVMQTLAIYSVSEPVGRAFGWLIWGANTAIILIAGFISLIMLPLMNKNKNIL